MGSGQGNTNIVILINRFEVPAGREEEFLRMFREVNNFMRGRPGYRGHKLHRSLAPDAAYRFVNVVTWASEAEFKAAHGAEFRAMVSRPEWAEFRAHPGLYEVVHDGEAGK